MKENRLKRKSTWIGRVPRILDDGARLPPLLLVDDPLVLLQLVVAHAVEGVLRVRRLEHRRVVLEVPLDDPLARRTNLEENIQSKQNVGEKQIKVFLQSLRWVTFQTLSFTITLGCSENKTDQKERKMWENGRDEEQLHLHSPVPVDLARLGILHVLHLLPAQSVQNLKYIS